MGGEEVGRPVSTKQLLSHRPDEVMVKPSRTQRGFKLPLPSGPRDVFPSWVVGQSPPLMTRHTKFLRLLEGLGAEWGASEGHISPTSAERGSETKGINTNLRSADEGKKKAALWVSLVSAGSNTKPFPSPVPGTSSVLRGPLKWCAIAHSGFGGQGAAKRTEIL